LYSRVVSDQTEQGPADAITSAENTLRELISSTLAALEGPDWIGTSGVSEDRLQRMRDRLAEEARRRRGTVIEQRLLYYSDLTDLKTIIDRRWIDFKRCLSDKRATDVYLDRLVDLRTAQMHGRELLPFERQLADGISGEFRNRVTLYRSGTGPNCEYFPRIEYVRDSFGNIAHGHGSARTHLETGLTLHPGDVVTFECHAWDPEAASYSWELFSDRPHTPSGFAGGSYVWTVAAQDIAERRQLLFYLVSDRSYHRHSTYDDSVGLTYRVLPAA
jgi:hypothetical protein